MSIRSKSLAISIAYMTLRGKLQIDIKQVVDFVIVDVSGIFAY